MTKPKNSSTESVKIDRLLTMKEFAQLTGMSLSWHYEQKKQGKLPAAICLGRARRYRESDVLAWIQQHSDAKEA
ncbi:helix-turn-helix transcriptional regulator [Lelliottia wanjuensis]|uniref:helix-turn-helix transcriptional regulator n=1 Tax=Lelliottia wanjuensis TaxID=3050585 RepID=UPI00255190A1|nr:helix-turn-helix domain-containing protein [Lelliottia sp. V86_10]MDK9584654.1 helix-turn-helix domain-containing protein [Lelliottia sp. V86_10]